MTKSHAVKLIFIPLCLLCAIADGWFNGFRTSTLYPDMQVGLWLLAFCIAFAAPLFDFFSRNDKFVMIIGIILASISFTIHLLSGYGAMIEEGKKASDEYQQRLTLQRRLEHDFNDQAMQQCADAPASMCRVQERRNAKEKLQAQIDALSSATHPTKSRDEYYLDIALLVALGALPFISLASARIINLWHGFRNQKQNHERFLGLEPKKDVGNHIKTVPAPVSVPKITEPTKNSATEESQKTSHGKGATARIPNKKQQDRLVQTYNAMKRRGDKITVSSLSREATVSKSAASWWLKNGLLPNVYEMRS